MLLMCFAPIETFIKVSGSSSGSPELGDNLFQSTVKFIISKFSNALIQVIIKETISRVMVRLIKQILEL